MQECRRRSQLRELRAAKDRSEAALGDAEDRCDRAEAAAHDLRSQLRVRFEAVTGDTLAERMSAMRRCGSGAAII